MINPTIGRVVLVHAYHMSPGAAPWPALVCYVHGDRCINVGGFTELGHPFARTSLPLLQDDDPAPPQGTEYAYWMPYQKAVAARQQEPTQHATGGAEPLGS